jgi:hypothetical protein
MNVLRVGTILVLLACVYEVKSFILPYFGSGFALRRFTRPKIVPVDSFGNFVKRRIVDDYDDDKPSYQKSLPHTTRIIEKDRNNLGYLTVKSIEDALTKLENYSKLNKVKDYINLYRIFAINLSKSLIPTLSDTEKSSVYSLTQSFIAENGASCSLEDLIVIFRNLRYFDFVVDNPHDQKLINTMLRRIQDKYDDLKKQMEGSNNNYPNESIRNDYGSSRNGAHVSDKVGSDLPVLRTLSNREVEERKKLLKLLPNFILSSLSKVHYSWKDFSKEQQKFLIHLMRKFINDKSMTERHYNEFLSSLAGLKMNWKDLESIKEDERNEKKREKEVGSFRRDLLQRIFSFKYQIKDFVSLRIMIISLGKLHCEVHKVNEKQLFEQLISLLKYSLDNVGNVEDVPRQVSLFLPSVSLLFPSILLLLLIS